MTQIPGFIYSMPVVGFIDDGVNFVPFTDTLTFESPTENPLFFYTVEYLDGGLPAGQIPFVDVEGPPVRVLLGGTEFDFDEVYAARLVSPTSGTHDILGLTRDQGVIETDVIILMGGAPLPQFANGAQLEAFFFGLSSIGQIPFGTPFAPGQDISFTQWPNVTVTEGLIDPIDGMGPGGPGGPGGPASPLPHDTLAEVMAVEGLSSDEAAQELLFRLFGALPTGVSISDVSYSGALAAAAWYDSFTIEALEPGRSDFVFGDGLMLSSGGMPADRNTSSGQTTIHSEPGHPLLTQAAQAAFGFAGETNDAAIIEFTITVTDPAIDGLRLGLVFGSDEYPEYADSSFVDIGAVFVNGVNVALFNDDPTTPLSVTQRNIDAGNFVDNNQPWPEFGPAGTEHYAVEWDGFSRQLSVRAPLQQGENTILIGVADTGDFILDSALFVNDLSLFSGGGVVSGVLNSIDASGGGTVQASLLAEEFLIGAAPVSVQGTPAQLTNGVLVGFKESDEVVFQGAQFGLGQVQIEGGSAILRIDTDGDGAADTTMVFAGDFQNRQFQLGEGPDGTVLTAGTPAALASVAGTIRGVDGEILTGAEVRAAMQGVVPRSTLSEDGSFSFTLPQDAGAEVSIGAALEFSAGAMPGFTVESALNALRLALGLAPSGRPAARPEDFIAADVNGDGAVTVADVFGILRGALSLSTDVEQRWVFVDADALGPMSNTSVSYSEGIVLSGLAGPVEDLSLTAILVGQV